MPDLGLSASPASCLQSWLQAASLLARGEGERKGRSLPVGTRAKAMPVPPLKGLIRLIIKFN